MFSRNLSALQQLCLYGLVGGGGTVCHYLVLMGLVEFGILAATAASSLGFVVGAMVNHELNRWLVFPGTRNSRGFTMSRFMAIAVVGFILNLGTMSFLAGMLGVYYLIAQICATLMVFVVTFGLNKIWTFQA